MIRDGRNRQLSYLGAMTAVLLLAATALAAENRPRPAKIGEYNPDAQTVEMFAAMEKGDIAVKLIPKDSTQSKIIIENKTDEPLNVKLPDAFAGVPILAQVGGGAGGAGGAATAAAAIRIKVSAAAWAAWVAVAWAAWAAACSASRPKASENSMSPPFASIMASASRGPPSPMRSSPSTATPPSPASASCARCSATARSATARLRPPPGTSTTI